MFIKILIIVSILGIAELFDDIIGNYSQYIRHYNQCGLNSRSVTPDDECFEYHKIFSSNIEDGRVGDLGELPWMVSVIGVKKLDIGVTTIILGKSACGGALISENWVLTAAHCVEDYEYNVFIGGSRKSGKITYYAKTVIKHKNYSTHPQEGLIYDIGLIKLDKTVDFENRIDGKSFRQNLICLPISSREIRNKRFYAISSGFGGSKAPWPGAILDDGQYDHPRVTTMVVQINNLQKLRYWTLKGTKVCKGDSGSPIWVNHMGRAVLIGIIQDIDSGECDTTGTGAYIPGYIDWIGDNMKLYANGSHLN